MMCGKSSHINTIFKGFQSFDAGLDCIVYHSQHSELLKYWDKEKNGKYYVFTDNGRERTGKEALSWAQESEKRFAGELIFTFIDNEGTGSGLDIEFINDISKKINIPIIVHGGISSIKDIIELFNNTEASAVAIASMLHYNCLLKNKSEFSKNEKSGNHDFLVSGKRYKNFGQHNLKDIKKKTV